MTIPTYIHTVDPMLLPSGNSFKCHEEVLYLQPMIPPKRFDISLPDWGMLRMSRCVQIFFQTLHVCDDYTYTYIHTSYSDMTTVAVLGFGYCVFKNQLLHRGGRLPVQRRCPTHHLLIAAIFQFLGVNRRLWICASPEARRLPHGSRWVISAAVLDTPHEWQGLTLLVDCIPVHEIHVSPAGSFTADGC